MSAFLGDRTDYTYASVNGPYIYYFDCPHTNPNIPQTDLERNIATCQAILNTFKVLRDDSLLTFSCIPKPVSLLKPGSEISEEGGKTYIIPAPPEGWCQNNDDFVGIGVHCGGNVPNPKICQNGLSCKLSTRNTDLGGECVSGL